VDGSYFTIGRLVEWLYLDGRGLWCKDCHDIWRLVFGTRTPLAFLAQWIRSNVDEWSIARISVLSLIAEGTRTRLSPELCQSRINLINWLSQFIGVPIGRQFVVRLMENGMFSWGSKPGRRADCPGIGHQVDAACRVRHVGRAEQPCSA
jgi:hypothetical protein